MTEPARCSLLSADGETLWVLSPGESIRIGRAASNEVRCADPTVSRFHARLSWAERGATPVLLNSGSANGLRVDGARVFDQAPLLDGARVELGQTVLAVRLEGQLRDPLSLLDLPAPAASPEPLSGALSPTRILAQVLCELERRRATGTLALTTPAGPLSLSLCLGRLLRARSPWGEDLDALRSALALAAGTYRLDWALEPGGQPLNVWVSDLLQRELRHDTPTARLLDRERSASRAETVRIEQQPGGLA